MRPEVHAALSSALTALVPLPVLGGTVARVRSLAADEHTGTDELVRVIEQDESFALNLLRFANSAASKPIMARNVRHAVTLVGRVAVGRLAVEAATYRFLQQVPGAGRASRGQMHVHAIAVASAALGIAERAGADPESAHLAGLLHDVGKLVLPVAFGPQAVESLVGDAATGARRARLEHERLGVDHAYAGALLARSSHAGDEVVEAIEFHHGGRSGQESPSRTAACVQLANALVSLATGHDAPDEILHVSMATLGMGLHELDELAESVISSPATASPTGLAQRVIELERLAHTDELTGVGNRRHWISEVSAALENGHGGSVLLCDVDHFKQVNDGFGHRAGDLVLIEVARILRRHGTTGRLGGDEFALWVPGASGEGQRAAAAVVDAMARELARSLEQAPTLSVGIATAPQHGREVAVLLEAADRALYAAKAAGRNRAVAALP